MSAPRIQSPKPRPYWVDTDLALGADEGDVDDGFALAALAAAHRLSFLPSSSEAAPRIPIQLLGISTIQGNTSAAQAQRCAEDLMLVAGLEDIPVVSSRHAVSSLAALPDDTVLLALGPLTHVAAAIRLDPDLLRRVDLRAPAPASVGWRWRAPWSSDQYLNTSLDPAAAKQVFGARFEQMRLVPLDVARKLHIGPREVARLSDLGPLGAYLAEHSQRWLSQTLWRYRSRRFPLRDLVVTLDALDLLDDPRRDWRRLINFDRRTSWQRFLDLMEAAYPQSYGTLSG